MVSKLATWSPLSLAQAVVGPERESGGSEEYLVGEVIDFPLLWLGNVLVFFLKFYSIYGCQTWETTIIPKIRGSGLKFSRGGVEEWEEREGEKLVASRHQRCLHPSLKAFS